VKQTEWKDGEEKRSEKNTTALVQTRDGVKYDFAFASDAFKLGAAGNLVKGDWTVDGAIKTECKSAQGAWKAKGLVHTQSPKWNNNMHLWLNAEMETNEKGTWTTVAKMNFAYEQWHFGLAGENKDGDMIKQYAQVVFNDKKAQYWCRLNEKATQLGGGCSIEHDNFTHSYEGTYDYGKDAEGMFGSPVSFFGGGEYDLGKHTTLGYTWGWGKYVNYNQEVSHKVDDKWHVSMEQSFDSEHIGTKRSPYDMGVGVTYKL